MNNFRDKSRGLTGLHTALEGLLTTIEQIPVSGGGGGGSATDSNFIDWVGRVAISTLTTTAKTVKGAINELKNGVDDALSNTENLDSAIGDITTLVTSDKSSVVDAINEVATDYIVDQGTSGIWTYRKWNSGFAECCTTQTISTTLTWTAWGSLYSSNENIGGQNFPFTFSTITDYQASIHEQNHWLLIGSYSMSKVGPIYAVSAVNNKSVTGKTYTISVKGTWK